MQTKVLTVFIALMISGASYAGDWKKDHPRRAEVNSRLRKQNARINQGVKNGQLTKGQARQLHREDQAIRAEERGMAAEHGGHITKAEQQQLNQQENRASNQIYNEKHPERPVEPAPMK